MSLRLPPDLIRGTSVKKAHINIRVGVKLFGKNHIKQNIFCRLCSELIKYCKVFKTQ